jgi:anti-anti-sigma factor
LVSRLTDVRGGDHERNPVFDGSPRAALELASRAAFFFSGPPLDGRVQIPHRELPTRSAADTHRELTMESKILDIYQAGELSVIGFGGQEVLDRIDLGECRDELSKLIDNHNCRTMAIDLTGVKVMPSGMLGLLSSIHRQGVEVRIYNACRDIREVVEITRLDQILKLHDVEV